MNATASDFPGLPRESTRPTTIVTDLNRLNEIGQSAGQYSMHVGDTIEFCFVNENGLPIVKSQALESGNAANYIAVLRNGQKSWISVGSLARLDKDMKPVDDFAKGYREKLQSSNFTILYKDYLYGKKITATEAHPVEMKKFNSDDVETRTLPIIKFA